jgi:hypothetical protein
MWFDQIDPRDPLKLTDGVWGLLTRYYFLNNANIWLWGLWKNDKVKGWESIPSNKTTPELGGRIQIPVPRGETGLSYHFRKADSRKMDSLVPSVAKIPEHKLGFDYRFDGVVGCWLEGSWTHKTQDFGILTNQEIINLGIDYTFNLGNGLYAVYEQLIASGDEEAFRFNNKINFSLLSLTYPVGLFDNLNAIVYFNWEDSSLYNFINWEHQFKYISMYVIGYWNPDNYAIPSQEDSGTLFAGKGLQVMVVYNY